MRPLKPLVRSDFGQRLLARLAAAYIRLIAATTRWQREMPPATAALLRGGTPCIIAFWHGRMIVMRGGWSGPPGRLHLLISEHSDGQLISRALGRLGFPTVSGSSRRGGAVALRAMQRLLGTATCVGITPDGPRGPRMRAKPGVIKAAQIAGVPILPVSGSIEHRRLLDSWDRFCLCLPFSRGLVLWGEPLTVPPQADPAMLEQRRIELERRLNDLTAAADRRLGQPQVEPAARQLADSATQRG